MRSHLRRQVDHLRQRIGSRAVLLLRGPDPCYQPERNIWHLYQDILWIGLAGTATTFTSVYAICLGASHTLVGLLSSMPSLIVILLRLPAARLVERTEDPVGLISRSLLVSRSLYLVLALLPLLRLAHEAAVFVALAILMGLPAVVANAGWDSLFADVVPERDRATVVSVRNSLASIMAMVVVLLGSKWLDWIPFPWNYQSIFLVALGGEMVSTYHVSQIQFSVTPPNTRKGARRSCEPCIPPPSNPRSRLPGFPPPRRCASSTSCRTAAIPAPPATRLATSSAPHPICPDMVMTAISEPAFV